MQLCSWAGPIPQGSKGGMRTCKQDSVPPQLLLGDAPSLLSQLLQYRKDGLGPFAHLLLVCQRIFNECLQSPLLSHAWPISLLLLPRLLSVVQALTRLQESFMLKLTQYIWLGASSRDTISDEGQHVFNDFESCVHSSYSGKVHTLRQHAEQPGITVQKKMRRSLRALRTLQHNLYCTRRSHTPHRRPALRFNNEEAGGRCHNLSECQECCCAPVTVAYIFGLHSAFSRKSAV